MRLALAIIGLVLFVGNYQICELVYSDNIDKWWGLKQNIYNIIIAIFSYLASNSLDKYFKFVMNIIVGFCISNCVDRLFFNINTFTNEDIYMIIITIIVSYFTVYKENIKKVYKYVSNRGTGTN